MLSNTQYLYVTSQLNKVPKINKSDERDRMAVKVKQALATFNLLLDSKELTQEYKNELFHSKNLSDFVGRLLVHIPDTSLTEENVKQAIARVLTQAVIRYYTSRFKETRFFKKKIEELQDLLNDLEEMAASRAAEADVKQLYRTRKGLRMPPKIRRTTGVWQARCDICWNYATAQTRKEAMRAIRHEPKCTYDKHDLEWCIRTYPPMPKQDSV